MTDASVDQTVHDVAALVAVLSAEHNSLNTTRSLAWGDSAARVTGFLSSLGAGTVALALIGQATDFSPGAFLPATILVLAVVLFLGLTSFVRLSQLNIEDSLLVGAMNRVRAGYLRAVPGAREYFATSANDDVPGIAHSLTYGLTAPLGGNVLLQAMVTAPSTVAVIDAVLLGLIAGSVALLVESGPFAATVVAVACAVLLFVGLMAWMARGWIALMRQISPLFHSRTVDDRMAAELRRFGVQVPGSAVDPRTDGEDARGARRENR